MLMFKWFWTIFSLGAPVKSLNHNSKVTEVVLIEVIECSVDIRKGMLKKLKDEEEGKFIDLNRNFNPTVK